MRYLLLILLPTFIFAEEPARVECLSYGNSIFWPDSDFGLIVDAFEYEENERPWTKIDFKQGVLTFETSEGEVVTQPIVKAAPYIYLSEEGHNKETGEKYHSAYTFDKNFVRLTFASGGDITAFLMCKRFKQ